MRMTRIPNYLVITAGVIALLVCSGMAAATSSKSTPPPASTTISTIKFSNTLSCGAQPGDFVWRKIGGNPANKSGARSKASVRQLFRPGGKLAKHARSVIGDKPAVVNAFFAAVKQGQIAKHRVRNGYRAQRGAFGPTARPTIKSNIVLCDSSRIGQSVGVWRVQVTVGNEQYTIDVFEDCANINLTNVRTIPQRPPTPPAPPATGTLFVQKQVIVDAGPDMGANFLNQFTFRVRGNTGTKVEEFLLTNSAPIFAAGNFKVGTKVRVCEVNLPAGWVITSARCFKVLMVKEGVQVAFTNEKSTQICVHVPERITAGSSGIIKVSVCNWDDPANLAGSIPANVVVEIIGPAGAPPIVPTLALNTANVWFYQITAPAAVFGTYQINVSVTEPVRGINVREDGLSMQVVPDPA